MSRMISMDDVREGQRVLIGGIPSQVLSVRPGSGRYGHELVQLTWRDRSGTLSAPRRRTEQLPLLEDSND